MLNALPYQHPPVSHGGSRASACQNLVGHACNALYHWIPADILCNPMPPGADLRSPGTRKAGPPGSRTPPRAPPLRGADLVSPTARTDGSAPRPPIVPRVAPGTAAGITAGNAHWRAADAAFPLGPTPAPAEEAGTCVLSPAGTPFVLHGAPARVSAGGCAFLAPEPDLACPAGMTPCAPGGAQGAAVAGASDPPPFLMPLEQDTTTPWGVLAAHGVPTFRADPPALPLLAAGAGVLAAAFAAPDACHAEH